MRFSFIYIAALVLAFSFTGCVDDEPLLEQGFEVESDSPLQFLVRSYDDDDTRKSEPSDTPEPENEDERKIENFWLYQFKPDGSQLAEPIYRTVPLTNGKLDLSTVTKDIFNNVLVKNTPMTIYVVTNVGDNTSFPGASYNTLKSVKEAALPSPYPIRVISDETRRDKLLIPMSGQVDNVIATDKSLIIVPVTRMYAKVKIQASFPDPNMAIYDVSVYNIPWYCRVAPDYTLDENGEAPVTPVPLPEGTAMISRAFASSDKTADGWITLYVPENLQGEQEGVNKQFTYNPEQKYGPDDALNVYVRAKYNGMDYDFYVYPGENEVNNFNVRRNCVYRVVVDVKNARDQHKPSSNCYVVKPKSKVTFEPYYRIEKGGGYNFANYLSPDNPDKAIAKTKIIWQTKDCIGDNTDGSRVKFEYNADDPIHSKLTVYTGAEGNALVGAYNAKGKIVWSWHIWVTNNEPDNYAKAYVYYTYRWDEGGIYTKSRIPGYGVMSCNLGALAFRSDDDMPTERVWVGYPTFDYVEKQLYSLKGGTKFPDSQIRTFGMMYQWGRKDPFPPMTCSTGTEDANGTLDYSNNYTDEHFANDNSSKVGKSDKEDENLFHSAVGAQVYRGVEYSIQNPTVYMTGTSGINNPSFTQDGDWCYPHDNKLWGGLDPTTSGLKKLQIEGDISIYDNYGEKSIFDPCPMGWRVPPGDLWLGFTETGMNPTNYNQVNQCKEENGHRPGLSMYMQRWQGGPTLYFPMQGAREYTGWFHNTGLCGNYHNATCVTNTRVNILHFHRDMAVVANSASNKKLMLFKVFETKENYIAKSTASPVRCVRDRK